MSAPSKIVPVGPFPTMLLRTALAIEYEATQKAGLERNRLLSLASAIRAEVRIQSHNNSVEGTK
jgi:hypothetical protein